MPARIAVLVMAVLTPLSAQPFTIQDYLPLTVGNSWTYRLEYLDTDVFTSGGPFPYPDWYDSANQQVTFTILRTEVIDGDTYYVFSDVPSGWPPAPVHSIAGKKLRWDGNNLVEHTGTSESTLFQFRAGPTSTTERISYEYTVSASDASGDTDVWASIARRENSIFECLFVFRGGLPDAPSSRSVTFISGYGLWSSDKIEARDPIPFAITALNPVQATLITEDSSDTDSDRSSGTRSERVITYIDALKAMSGKQPYPGSSSTSKSSWGRIKEGSSE